KNLKNYLLKNERFIFKYHYFSLMISIVLLGAGNLATHLFKAFSNSDKITINQWFNKSISTIKQYKNKVAITDDMTQLALADVYILAVSDDAIAELSSKLPFEDRLVVHTSGSVNIHDLDKKNRRGVFYPLQTFSKDAKVDFTKVPICIEVLKKTDLAILK